MTHEVVQTLLTAALAAGGSWAAVHAELRALWRSHGELSARLLRLENQAMNKTAEV